MSPLTFEASRVRKHSMKPPLRLAVVDRCGADLSAQLERLAEPCELRDVTDLATGLGGLVDDPPDALILAQDDLPDADLAVLRVLRHRAPRLRIVLIVPAEREFELEAAAAGVDARLLTSPLDAAGLAEVVQLLRSPPGQTSPTGFLELTRGLSDEINNPLLFVQGHAQLLEALCDPVTDADKLEQITAIQRGLSRIAATMEKLLLASRARGRLRPEPPVSLGAAFQTAIGRLDGPGAERARELVAGPLAETWVHGDGGLLAAALQHLLEVVLDLGGGTAAERIRIDGDTQRVRIVADLAGLESGHWQLPRTFEPYHLARFLNSSSYGLNLFLVQTIVHAHGGSASARRLPEGRIALEITLPRAAKGT